MSNWVKPNTPLPIDGIFQGKLVDIKLERESMPLGVAAIQLCFSGEAGKERKLQLPLKLGGSPKETEAALIDLVQMIAYYFPQ